MQFDHAAWERSDEIFDTWKAKLVKVETLRELGHFISKHRGGVAEELCKPERGAYNVTIRMLFRDGGAAIMRIPCPGVHMFPEEKVRNEVAVMRYLAEHTTIPISFVLHHGTAEECPLNLGPFIIMEYVKNAQTLSCALNLPGLAKEERPILHPGIDEQKLAFIYEQVADIMVQLSNLRFEKIGTPLEVEPDVWAVTERPLMWDMNELVQLANCPRSELLSTTFNTSSDFYSAVADMKVIHLDMQHNDAIESEEDCRRKYIGRHLFRKLAREKRLHDPRYANGPFRFWCDDFRPGNILVDEDCRIVSVIDCAWSYTAHAEFAYNPPWWLLLETPEYWLPGIKDWTQVYEGRLNTFLRVLAEREHLAVERGRLEPQHAVLANRMRENWESGQFWIDDAVRRSWAFDAVFWTYIDPNLFGGNGLDDQYEDRLMLLDKEEREGIDEFVRRKVEEGKERKLRDWDSEPCLKRME
ncbi:phosphotransferase family protein [Sporormia fimetaria CBS 119925]|uniref:Phosphotransferase family protein n=1 Tax=Sporormia fimetaria CBS 119925 TaxID=1340428 RepID=A0A6A6UU11_9PLEO|nr:phosphotransferase family protein [Sporormia fimetaria CBS 119925]